MDRITRIILSHQARGLDRLIPLLPEDACMKAAEAIRRIKRSRVWIVTGFCCFGQGESDGPLGSHFLALALQKMGFSPRMVTDRYSITYFQEAPYPSYCYQTENALLQQFEAEKPSLLIAVERCGRAEDGHYYSMRKKKIDEVTPPLDQLFLQKPSTCLSIGIGDGGNEIGMGNYKEALAAGGQIIPSRITCDHTIVATVSNWGAYGLIAALDAVQAPKTVQAPMTVQAPETLHEMEITIKQKDSLLPSSESVEIFFNLLMSKGATDGILGAGARSVDGFPIRYDLEILEALRQL